MSANPSFTKFQLGVAAWANRTANPNTAAETGGASSLYLKSSAGGTSPTEIYVNLFGTTTGWVKQNLINLQVFNVKDPLYGAKGDGTTDDTVSIQAAITAAIAAGGGIVYFPATAAYYKIGRRLTTLASFELNNVSNLTFMGDGYASKLKLEGNGGLGVWYMWMLRNGTARINYYNLYFDSAGVTNANEQTHIFNVSSETGELSGARNCKWIGCYWGESVGDGIRFIGTIPSVPTFDHLVKYNAFDMTGSRAPLGGQRNSERIRVMFNWFTGSDDQNIDFEATGQGAPRNWTIFGNIFDAGAKKVPTVTLGGSGLTAPSVNITFSCNQIHNGGNVFAIDAHQLHAHGNILIQDGTDPLGSVFEMQDGIIDCEFTANVLDTPGATVNVNGFFLTSSTHNPTGNIVNDNIIKAYGDNNGGSNIFLEESPDSQACGNILDNANANTIKSSPIIFRTITHDLDGLLASGNLIYGSNTALKAGVSFAVATGFQLGNSIANFNHIKNTGNGIRWDDSSSTGIFIDWRGGVGNNCPNATLQPIFVPPDQNIGATIEGNPGPAARILLFDNAAGPEGGVPSVIGSLATNLSGGPATTLFYKETDSGILTSNTGWLDVGPSELIFCVQDENSAVATALFMATGMGLVVATAVEIQLAMPMAGILRNLRFAGVAGTGGGNVTFTVRKNGVDTGLLLMVANTATVGSSSSATITVAPGDLISIKITKTGVISTAQTLVSLTTDFTPRAA